MKRIRRIFEGKNLVSICRSSGPLPRASGCHNVTCLWGVWGEVGEKKKEGSPHRAHQPRHGGRPDLIINTVKMKKKETGEAKGTEWWSYSRGRIVENARRGANAGDF